MRKGVLVSIAALLAACCAVATTTNDAAESAPQKSAKAKKQPSAGFRRYEEGGMAGCFDPKLSGYARAAAERIGGVPCETPSGATGQPGSGDPWIGEYGGRGDGAEMMLTIAARGAPGRYAVSATLIGDDGHCGGSLEGTGTAAGNRMTLTAPLGADLQCRMTFTRQGSTLTIARSDACAHASGRSCGFGDSVTRNGRDPAVSSVRGGAPSSQPSIIGVWVHQGGYCASGDPLVFEAGGGYRNSGGDLDGRWSLAGNTIAVFVRDIDLTSGEPEGSIRREMMRLSHVNANEIRLNQTRMRRCPAGGGAEPWHPGQRFTTR